MPGTIVFKPIEANLNHDSDLIGKADPYCMFLVGDQKIKGQVCKSGGKHPIWNDAITVQPGNQTICLLEIKDKDILKDDKIGTCEIDLREIESQGRVKKWYPIFNKDKPAGEILMEATFSGFGQGGAQFQGQAMPIQTQGIPIQGQGILHQGQGMPIQGQGILHQGQGMPIQGQGFSYQGQTIPSQGMTYQSQGIPLERNILVGGAPISNTTQIHTKETIISGGANQYGAGMMQGNAYQSGYSNMNESYSDQYAREALIRGVDPLGTHLHNYPGGNLPAGHTGAPFGTQPANIPGQGLGQNFQPNQF